MFKKIFGVFALCSTIMIGGVLAQAEAATTMQKYNQSTICVIVMKDSISLLAEPNLNSLVIGQITKGTELVPINQQMNTRENLIYNLVVRADGTVGWIDATAVKIVGKKAK